MSQSHLVLFDADHIKDYVFTTGRLKEIRGASEMVRQLTDETQLCASAVFAAYGLTPWESPGPARIIYAAGGAGAILFADGARAQAFCQDLEGNYQRQTRSATLSAVTVSIEGIGPVAELDAQRQGARALARRKASKPQIRALPGGGLLRFGDSDRLHPAEVQLLDPDDQLLVLSEETARKRKLSFDFRRAMADSPFWEGFRQALPERQRENWQGLPRESQDLNTIGTKSHPSGYVAFIHLDGDSVGSALREVVRKGGFAAYHRFSQALDTAAQTATAQALATAYQNHVPSRHRPRQSQAELSIELPFELITIGGDDVMLVCTAEHGLGVARMISAQFGPLVHSSLDAHEVRLEHPLSASVGVVIAHASMPIVQLQERARELLKNAKHQRDPKRDVGIGFFDFQIVTTPALDQIKLLRQQGYQGNDGAEFTRRPYRCDHAETLLRQAQILRHMPDFSGSKRTDLYNACAESRMQATLDVLTVSLRLRAAERTVLLHALHELDSVSYFPFTQEYAGGQLRFRTALLDLLEVVEFTPGETQ